jgi:hypothetical protein
MDVMFQEVSRELLRQGLCVRFRPGGQSMQPTIRDGEAVTVAPVRATEVSRGDILLYGTEKGLIAHRVLGIYGDCEADRLFILRGDSSVSADEPVRAEQVLGRVVAVEREGRGSIRLCGRRARIRHDVRRLIMKIRRQLSPRARFLKFLLSN